VWYDSIDKMHGDKTMNNLVGILEKIFGVLGYDLYESFVKVYFDIRKKRLELKAENEFSIKKSIFENENLSLEQKVQINAIWGKSLTSFIREMEILGIAMEKFDDNANENNISEDWLLDFFDKASRITEESTKELWGTMLAESASDKRLCSKTLLNSLFLMGTDDILSFLNVCRFTLSEKYLKNKDDNITAYPIIYFSENVEKYNVYMLSSFKLNRLQRLGLIEVDYKSEYVFSEKCMELIYANHVIKIENDKKIKIGNVRFTYDGFLLYQISQKLYDNSLLDKIINIWRNRKYTIYINGHIVKPISD